MVDVYVVTDGSYSDYHICTVFDNEEAADAHASEVGGQVEVFDLRSDPPQKFVRRHMITKMLEGSGEVFEDYHYDRVEFDYGTQGQTDGRPDVVVVGPFRHVRGGVVRQVVSNGVDHARLEKAHRDRVAKERAQAIQEPSAPR